MPAERPSPGRRTAATPPARRRTVLGLRGRVITPLEAGGVELIDDGVIAVDDAGTIVLVAPWRKARRELSLPIRDLRPHLLLPGFVDAHVHYPQTEIIGHATGPLLDWLATSVFPEEARFRSPKYAQRVAARFLHRMVTAGTTSAAIFSSSNARATELLFRLLADHGLRALVGLTLMDTRCPKELAVPRVEALREARALARRWHGFDAERLRFAVTPRFALSSTRALLRDAGKLASELALPIQTHVAETEREGAETLAVHKYAKSYLEVYDLAGLLNERTLLAHGIHLAAADWRLLAARGAHIVHCPDSNFFLGSGRMRVAEALRHGVSVALGSDVAAGRTFSMRRVMASAYDNAMCVKAPLRLEDLFTMATLGGARALGQGTRTGSLEPGKDADVIALACSTRREGLEGVLQELIFDTDRHLVTDAYVRGRRLSLEAPPPGR